jgi:hypothetical protein
VAHHHDVLDLERVHRELDHRQRIQVGLGHHIGHVAVHEQLARQQAHQLIGRHAAVGAADPQVLRRLLLEQAGEEAGRLRLGGRGPLPVLLEEFVQLEIHGAMLQCINGLAV